MKTANIKLSKAVEARIYEAVNKHVGANLSKAIVADVVEAVKADRRNEYARAYYRAHREVLAERSRLCHAKARAAKAQARVDAAAEEMLAMFEEM